MSEKIFNCLSCGKDMPDHKEQYCCNGLDCDCRGMPVNEPICSEECFDKLYPSDKEDRAFEAIIVATMRGQLDEVTQRLMDKEQP